MQIFTSNHHICAQASLQMPYAYITAQLNNAAVVHTTTHHRGRPSKRAKPLLQPMIRMLMYTTTPQTSNHDARTKADAGATDAPCSSLLDFLYNVNTEKDDSNDTAADSSTNNSEFVPKDLDDALEWYMNWAHERGIDLWDHQIDALLSIASGNHVILGTPTGSGKSMVAIGMAFFCLCQDRVMYYTAPIKALVSEKFFNLVDLFGKDLVGMITGLSLIHI